MNCADEYRAFTDSLMKRARRKSKSMQLTNEAQADWCLRRMGELEQSIVARAEFVQLEVAKLQAWLAHRNSAETKKLSSLHRLLLTYASSLRDSGRLHEGESFELPHGTLQLAPSEPRFVRDDTALLSWAKASRPDVLEVRTSIAWDKLKPDLQIDGSSAIDKQTGQKVDGVHVQELAPHIIVRAFPSDKTS